MSTITLKILRCNEEAIIPSYANPGDAGLDLTATSFDYKEDIDCYVYGTGLKLEIPEGYVGLLFPRSSNRKTDAYMCNHVGVLDSGYRGEVMVSFKLRDKQLDAIPTLIKPYEIGDRIAQLIIIPIPYVNVVETTSLSSTERGEKGHGSSGN